MSVVLAIALPVQGVTERITTYEYDDSGNIVLVRNQQQNAPPIVDSLSPGFVNIGRNVAFTATGENLLGARVTTDTPGLSITEVTAQFDAVTFRLLANALAPIGPADLRCNLL